jgi:hypothetical protein
VAELRRTDRARVVGERSHARYFPMASAAASAAWHVSDERHLRA